MSAAAISSAAGVSGNSPNAFADLDSGEFIKVIMSELSNQDPMNPQDTGALLEQLSSLRNIESQTALQTQLESLVQQNQIAAAGGMIGKMVSGLDDGNSKAEGLVASVRVRDDRVMLELDTGKTLAMDRVQAIWEPTA